MRRALVRVRTYFASEGALTMEERYPRALSALHWGIGVSVVGVVASVKLAQGLDRKDPVRGPSEGCGGPDARASRRKPA